jgi:hypothetical protein
MTRLKEDVVVRDELMEFLDCMLWEMPNLNDTFGYAAADSERIYMDGESNQEKLVEMFRRYGISGINAYVSKIRGQDVIKPLQTDAYYAAKQELEDWEYEAD